MRSYLCCGWFAEKSLCDQKLTEVMMEIRANSKYDFETVRALTHAISYKKREPKKSFTISMIFWGIMAVFAVFALPEMLLAFLVVLGIFLNLFQYFLLPKMQYRLLAKLKETENEFIFGEESFRVISRSAAYQGEAEMRYELIVKVIENSRYFFIYQTNNQVYAVDKQTITGGSAEDIRKRMEPGLGKKYMVCKY